MLSWQAAFQDFEKALKVDPKNLVALIGCMEGKHMAGKYEEAVVLALPGNPASAFVSATLFLLPLIKYMSGAASYLPDYKTANSTSDLLAVESRTKFLRAVVNDKGITPFNSQDSAKLSVLAASNALLVRPAHSIEVKAGQIVPYISI